MKPKWDQITFDYPYIFECEKHGRWDNSDGRGCYSCWQEEQQEKNQETKKLKTHELPMPKDLVLALEWITEKAKRGEIKGFIFAAYTTDEYKIGTARINVNIQERQELIAHQQTDLVYDVVLANLEG